MAHNGKTTNSSGWNAVFSWIKYALTGKRDETKAVSQSSVNASSLVDLDARLRALENAFAQGQFGNVEADSLDAPTVKVGGVDVKAEQSAVDVSGSTAKTLTRIEQDEQGKVTPTFENIRSASTQQSGIVKLNDAVDSTSTAQAATANAVKKTYDKTPFVVVYGDSTVLYSDLASKAVSGVPFYLKCRASSSEIGDVDIFIPFKGIRVIDGTVVEIIMATTNTNYGGVTAGEELKCFLVKTANEDKVDWTNSTIKHTMVLYAEKTDFAYTLSSNGGIGGLYNAGSVRSPVYFRNGVPVECSGSIIKKAGTGVVGGYNAADAWTQCQILISAGYLPVLLLPDVEGGHFCPLAYINQYCHMFFFDAVDKRYITISIDTSTGTKSWGSSAW